jgi:carbon monoxide dehydrogenase subunit G
MPQFTKTILIDAPRSEVWRTLADLEAVELYSPSVKTATYTLDERERVGASRYCDFHGPGSVNERVVNWEEGERLGIHIEKGFPAEDVIADFRLRDEDGGTRVDVHFSYERKYGPIGALMDRLMMRSYAEKAMHSLVKGLKRHTETGERQEPRSRTRA